MDYTDANNTILDSITALGERGLVIFLAAIVLAGSVFLIRWGFRVGKNALEGDVSSFKGFGEFDVDDVVPRKFRGDHLSRKAFRRGKYLNERDGINLYD